MHAAVSAVPIYVLRLPDHRHSEVQNKCGVVQFTVEQEPTAAAQLVPHFVACRIIPGGLY